MKQENLVQKLPVGLCRSSWPHWVSSVPNPVVGKGDTGGHLWGHGGAAVHLSTAGMEGRGGFYYRPQGSNRSIPARPESASWPRRCAPGSSWASPPLRVLLYTAVNHDGKLSSEGYSPGTPVRYECVSPEQGQRPWGNPHLPAVQGLPGV